MKHWKYTVLLAVTLIGGWLPTLSHAKSKRIIVYPLSQNYIDTHPGDSLSGIVDRLLPNNPQLQQNLMADILRLNPDAFIQHDPNRLLANIRLWLPNQPNNAKRDTDSGHYRVEHFSWGSIKRPK